MKSSSASASLSFHLFFFSLALLIPPRLILPAVVADTLTHSYCWCETSIAPPIPCWGWVQHISYHSDRLDKSYAHDFKCEPQPGHRDDVDFNTVKWGECSRADRISGRETPFCELFEDGVEVCVREWQYAFDGYWMERLPGWYKGGDKYVEGSSKNKKRVTLTDCTAKCRRAFPNVVGIDGDCNYTFHDEIVTPVQIGDQCRIYEYKALSVL